MFLCERAVQEPLEWSGKAKQYKDKSYLGLGSPVYDISFTAPSSLRRFAHRFDNLRFLPH